MKGSLAFVLFVILLAGCAGSSSILLVERSSGKIVACDTETCAGQMEATGYQRLSREEAEKVRSRLPK